MLTKTPIEWAFNGSRMGHSWNFVTGCHKISPGCKFCYAEAHAKRFWGDRPFSEVRIDTSKITAPLSLRKPSTLFVDSMSDLFQNDVPFPIVQEALHVMAVTQHLHYIILTKRAERMWEFFNQATLPDFTTWRDNPLPNVTLGVSVETNPYLDRVSMLLATPAAKRIISFEPLLEEVNALSAMRGAFNGFGTVPAVLPGAKIDHAIIGGESGKGARPCHIPWIASLVHQCDENGTKVFVKQLGAKAFTYSHNFDQLTRYKTTAKKGQDPAEWPDVLKRREIIHPVKLQPYK